MPQDINWIWKNTSTPEAEALADGIIENRFDREYEDFENDLAQMLFLSFKAGYEAKTKEYNNAQD